MATIAVLGATGHVGTHLSTMLAAGGHAVRAVHLHPGNAPHLEGVETMRADLTDPEAANRALEGVTAAYLAPAQSGPDPARTERTIARNVARAAADASVEHLVAHTALHADRTGTGVPMLASHREVERTVMDSGVPWTLLRPGLFLDTLLDVGPHARRDRVLVPFPPAHPFGAVAARDVARAAAGLFVAGPQERAFDLHLPGGTSGEDLAYMLSEMMDRPMDARESEDGVDGFAAKLDMNPAQRDLYRGLLEYVRASEYVGEPEAIREAVPEFGYTPLRSVVHADILPRWREFEVSAS